MNDDSVGQACAVAGSAGTFKWYDATAGLVVNPGDPVLPGNAYQMVCVPAA
jgi:hypothetical protein